MRYGYTHLRCGYRTRRGGRSCTRIITRQRSRWIGERTRVGWTIALWSLRLCKRSLPWLLLKLLKSRTVSIVITTPATESVKICVSVRACVCSHFASVQTLLGLLKSTSPQSWTRELRDCYFIFLDSWTERTFAFTQHKQPTVRVGFPRRVSSRRCLGVGARAGINA